MMAKFNFEDYRQPWETGPHWELKQEFIETYQDMFDEDRLLCLAQAYANVVLMSCSYPDDVMRQISELSKPLQLRKKFQDAKSNAETKTSTNEQSRVSEKLKSVYELSGRPFKQVKFCASKEQYNTAFLSDSSNLSQPSSEKFENSSPALSQSSSEKSENSSPAFNQQDNQSVQTCLIPSHDAIKETVPNQQAIKSVSPKSSVPYFDVMKETQSSHYSNLSLDKDKNDKIMSVLGLPFIQNFAYTMKKFASKIDHPVGAIHCIIEKLGLVKDYTFDIDVDPTSPNNKILYKAKFLIKNCEIASSTAGNKKGAKKLAAEAAINTLYKLSVSHAFSNEDVLQLFSKKIANISKKEPAIVTVKTVASLLDMDDYIAFDVVSKEISASVTEYCCKFFLKDILISIGKDNISDNAKNMAADLGIVKLSSLSEYEIQNGELKRKYSNSFNRASSSDSSMSTLSQPSTEICTEKPSFILNRTMYSLSLRDNFVLVEKLNKAGLQKNEKSILNESAAFNHKTYTYEFEDVPTYPSKKAILLIAGSIVGTGIGVTKEEAKTDACIKALNDLKQKYYTLRIKEEYIEGFIITRNQVFDGESFSSNVISESNIGCKMLKSMGWTGGGLGEKGIAEPIQATAKLSLGSGLGFEGSEGNKNSQLFRKRLEAMLREFCKSENYCDLIFSKDFTKEERKEIHQIAGRLHLHTQSRGVGDERFLTIRQKYQTANLLKYLVNNGGSNSKFELIDGSNSSVQV